VGSETVSPRHFRDTHPRTQRSVTADYTDIVPFSDSAERSSWGMATIRDKMGHLDYAIQFSITGSEFVNCETSPLVHNMAILHQARMWPHLY
jgi:hypothetical protein